MPGRRRCSSRPPIASACDIFVEKDGEKVNGKSIMGLMMLAAGPGSKLTIHAEGNDASAGHGPNSKLSSSASLMKSDCLHRACLTLYRGYPPHHLMAAVDIDVNYVAHLARLSLSPEEAQKFGAQLSHVLGLCRKTARSGRHRGSRRPRMHFPW